MNILDQAKKNKVKCGDLQSAGMMKEVLDTRKVCAITRHGYIEAYLVPAELMKDIKQ